MAIADFAEYQSKLAAPNEVLLRTLSNLGTVVGWPISTWTAAIPSPGVAPTTAVVPTNATAGAIGQKDGTESRLMRLISDVQNPACFILCDRLAHSGGLVGDVNTAQTTNLPSAALSRYTTGVGVFAALEIYTIIGTTATTFTVSYTDQDGTAGNTSGATVIGGTSHREAGRIIPINLAAGDTGVRSVESVTLLATTGTPGNIGVTLFRPLAMFDFPRLPMDFDMFLGGNSQMPEILDGACLFWIVTDFLTSTGVSVMQLSFADA